MWQPRSRPSLWGWAVACATAQEIPDAAALCVPQGPADAPARGGHPPALAAAVDRALAGRDARGGDRLLADPLPGGQPGPGLHDDDPDGHLVSDPADARVSRPRK